MAVVEDGEKQFEGPLGPIKLALKAFVEWEGILHKLAIERAGEVAAKYRADNCGLSLAGFADVLVACQDHADADALLEVIDEVASDPRFGALISLVDGAPLAAGFAQSWAAAHPGLPGSKQYEAEVADLVEMAESARVEDGEAPVEVQEALA
jgi:hypothetical protein